MGDAGYDVIALFPVPQGTEHNMYEFADTCHPGFLLAWERMMKVLGHDDFAKHGVPPAFYCNLWLMRGRLAKEFAAFLKAAIDACEDDPDLKVLLDRDSTYGQELLFVPKVDMHRIYGSSYYALHPFIMERLICYWVHFKGLRIKFMTPDASELHMQVYSKSKRRGGLLL
jgi:hypothetical protein